MVPQDHDERDDLDLESILDEYRGFDPEAPEAVPEPAAAFASRTAEAELIDAGPDELLTPEALLALEADEPEAEDAQTDEPEPEAEPDLFGEETPGAGLISREELDAILAEAHADDEEDVREYHPHSHTDVPPAEPEEETEIDGAFEPERGPGMLAGLRTLARRFADMVAPPLEPEDEAEPETPAQTAHPVPDDTEEPTQVFQAVAETFGEDLTVELPEEEARIWAEEVRDADGPYAEVPEEEDYDEVEAPEPDIPAPEEPDEYDEEDDADLYEEVERRSFQEAVVRPLVERIAAVSWRVRERREASREEAAEEEELGPEPTARQAHRYYASRESALQSRSRLALIVSLVLLYLSSGLPVLGLLRNSPRVMALMCLILQLTVMLIGLDVLTLGLTSFRQKRPGIESLVLLGCVFSLIDAALCAVFNSLANGLPYCVVSAFAVTFLLYSSFCRARGYGLTFHVLSRSNEPAVLTAGTNEFYDGITLSKTKRSADGFVHRAEEPGPDAVLFAVLTPYIIAAAVILSLLATVLSGSFKNAGHVFAAVFGAAAPLAAILVYTVPFRSLAAFLHPKGLAVAGWSGASDIGRSRRFVVTDRDLFGTNAITIDAPVFMQNMSEAKIAAYAASLVCASGCCLAPAFLKLLEGYNYPLFKVDRFRCDSAGGMSGYIYEEEVLFGTLEFMRLKDVADLKPDPSDQTNLYIAVNHELCGMFPVTYQPMRSVKSALQYLLKSSERPVFAVRDPNITPSMLKERFRTQADGFDFPPFRQRYLLSDPDVGAEDSICGVVTRSGLAQLLSITKTGKQLYRYVHGGLIAAMALLIIGVVAMFWLCSMGSFATGSAFHLALYQLISALLVPLICHFVRR